MARQTRRLIDLHQKALRQFDTIQSALKGEREQCLQDRRFCSIPGAQWEGDLGFQFENKPKFEVNKLQLSVIRIFNEYRNNRITVDFVPKDGKADKLSDLCDGRYRSDEQDSGAQEAYDNAFDEGVSGGFGAWRLRPVLEDEEDEENDYQRICFEPIYDADTSVYFDLAAKRQDKSDAKYCYVISSIPRDEYKERYGDDPTTWPKSVRQTEFDWETPDIVYIAEYFEIEKYTKLIEIWESPGGKEERYSQEDFDENPDLRTYLIATGSYKDDEKHVTKKRVHKYILSGGGVIEDCGYLPGAYLPIVPMYGKRWFVDNVERCMGHVRLSKDAQRLKNMQLSKLGEISALSSVEKPILTPEQVAGHENMWADDNLKNWPYLLVNPITDMNGNLQPAGPLAYTKPPQIPPAMAALLQITEQDMRELLGNQQAGEEMMPNVSGKTVELIQNKLDMQAYIYMSNMAKAIKRSGEIWLSMAKDIYVENGRHLKIVSPQKDTDNAELMRPVVDPDTGERYFENDFRQARHDVTVSVGPSTSSKRAATVRALSGILQMTTDPETQQILSAMAMMNIEGEGVDEIRQYYRKKLIRLGVIEPNDAEAKELAAEQQAMANQPDPQKQYLDALAAESFAKAQKAQADTALTAAKTEETQAKTAETLAGMNLKEQQAVLDAIQQLEQLQRPTTMQ